MGEGKAAGPSILGATIPEIFFARNNDDYLNTYNDLMVRIVQWPLPE